eukprot:TRINITY_DN5393_c0_g1_i1.p1 TRINITY_DN5393_c0_g1~~TRINITY_DN5393_c0_g1_i1.p1  ORF type:complete len:196 (+),score=38.52 TRINITY_DN5393_c0_g1_i1:84-671(+)
MLEKVVVLGDGAVGKSCITIQLVHNYFTLQYDPTIENSYRKQMTVDDKPAVLDILDTAGQEEYLALRDQYICRGEGFALVFSLTNRLTFNHIEDLYNHILRVKDVDQYPVVILGNKSDLLKDREVQPEEGRKLAERLGVPFLETSAKTGYNVEDGFLALVRELRKYREKHPEPVQPFPHLGTDKESKRNRRCVIL